MSGRVEVLSSGHRVLIDEPTDEVMQAVMAGRLELDESHLVLVDGELVAPVLLPHDTQVIDVATDPAGPQFIIMGRDYRLGDRIRSGGGHVPATEAEAKRGHLRPGSLLAVLQQDR